MALTREFKKTIVDRVQRDKKFAYALLEEAATLIFNGEPETTRLILCDLVNATVWDFVEEFKLFIRPVGSS